MSRLIESQRAVWSHVSRWCEYCDHDCYETAQCGGEGREIEALTFLKVGTAYLYTSRSNGPGIRNRGSRTLIAVENVIPHIFSSEIMDAPTKAISGMYLVASAVTYLFFVHVDS